jgi:hypothetical protein
MRAFILNLVITIVLFVIFVVSFIGFSGFGLFFEPLSLIIMILFPLIFQSILYGNFLKKAFGIAFEKNGSKDYLQKAYSFFENYGQLIWITAITLVAVYTVICVKYLEDKSGIGPMLQFLIDTIIYAGSLHLLIVLPYKIIIKNKIISFE